jgi:hypothetical protein
MSTINETGYQQLTQKKPYKIYVPSLTCLDQLELEKHLTSDVVRFETDPLDRALYGDLALATAIVIVSLAALRVLAVHLAKKRKEQTMRYTVKVEEPDGQKKELTIEVNSSSSELPDAQILKQLARACEVDLSGLTDL